MMNDLDAINAKLNLVQLAEQAGSKLHRAGHEWRGNCPLHGGNNPTGFVIYDEERRWQCFTGDCGGGDKLGFLMKLRNIGLIEAINLVTGGVPIPKEEIERIHAEQERRAAAELERKQKTVEKLLASLQENQVWLRHHETLEESIDGRAWWRARGIGDDFQNYWQLGYQIERTVWFDDGEIRVPAASIPIFGPGWKCQQVKYRLIGAVDDAGKYRYEIKELPAPLFLCDPDKPEPETLVLVEGEIKAMVTYQTLEEPDWQVIGLPGKRTPLERVKEFSSKAKRIYICCDPDTYGVRDKRTHLTMSEALSQELGVERCITVETPLKIDDYILECGITKAQLKALFNQGRRIRL